MKIRKYTKLGILMVFSITVLIWGLSYLQGNDFFSNINYYHIRYERVDGLSESNEVTLNGYKVGQVNKINFADDLSGDLYVTITIDGSVKLPVNSEARIVSSDILGTRSISLILGDGNEIYQTNDTIPGSTESGLAEQVSLQVLPLKNKAEQLLGTIDSAITVLTVIFNEEARDNLTESFNNINYTITNIEQATSDIQLLVATEKDNIANIIQNLNNISESFSNSTNEFENLVQNLSEFSDTLSTIEITKLFASLSETTGEINNIITKLNSEEGTAGQLINNEELYTNLLTLTDNLNRLMVDIRTNPNRYLHFSALDLGKEIYIASSESDNEEIEFRINLISTTYRLPIESEIFKNYENVEEYFSSGAYSYLYGSTNNYDEIVEIHEKTIEDFPDASIISFRNGRIIRLERALRLLNK